MSNINKAAVLNPFSDLTANILDYVPRATTSEFGIVAIGSGINVDNLGRIYLDTQEYSDRLTAIEEEAASTLATQKSEVAAAIAQVNLTQSQTISTLTTEVDALKTNLTDSITATQNDLIARADQLAQDVTDITQQLDQDKAAFTQEIQDALVYLENAESVASALRTPRKINGVDFDGTQDITLPLASTSVSGTVQLNDTLTSTSTDHALTAAQGKVLNDTKLAKTENAVSASKLQTSRTISLTGGVTGSISFDGSEDATIATTVTGLGAANGIATLDSSGKVPSTQLPSYVDDVLEYLNVEAFPTTGETGKIYVETTGNTTYRWSGSNYIKITSGEVSSVAGKTGVVTLTKTDVGLSNVDNTADSTKSVATAAKLTTARTIGGISFDGSANISLPGVNTAGNQSTSGNAATATKFQTPRTINGVLFDGTQDISVPTVDTVSISNGGTGATTLEGARANLGISSVQLPAGTNLNDVTTAGTYYCSLDVHAATMLNRPTDYSFSLKVDITAGVIQELTTYATSGNRRFIRGFYGTWTQWEEVVKGHKRLDTSGEHHTGMLSPNTQAGIYIHDDGYPFFWQGSAPTAPRWSINAGGTGGTTAAEARANLGLGSAALYNIGMDGGQVITVGNSFGLGWSGGRQSYENFNQFLTDLNGKSQFVGVNTVSTQEVADYSAGIFSQTQDTYFYIAAGPFSNSKVVGISGVGLGVQPFQFRTSRDTWVDGNGFIKIASPVVELYANEIKLNNEAKDQDIVFEKVGVGSYLLKGTTGLAQDGWYIEQPKDSNGNIFHAVEYGTHENGDIWIKTYEQMLDGTRIVADHNKPVDIKENRFISVRLNALPEDTSAPINPTIKDNEGNAAPSRLHELVNGVWVISDENAAILEQERLAAMKPLKRRQFRLTLAMNGYDLNEIETLITQIEDPMQRTIAQIEWQDATDFERTNPTLLMMAQMLGLTSEQVDSLWEYGLTL